ncbi:MAG: metallophosphoesterase [Crocinitomicaceae bacterium]|nr:metallophosphoesterase [Crocinitomicaceae bacterium]
MNLKTLSITFVICALVLAACQETIVPDEELEVKEYICISRTRTDSSLVLPQEVINNDLLQYDLLMLGGDLALLSSEDTTTLSLLDAQFDLGAPTTLWAMGNHDYTDVPLASSYTKRPTFYTFYQDGISFMVLDTQMDSCSILGEQKQMFDNVIDTISASSHLVILHHKMIWMVDDPVLHNQIDSISNGPMGNWIFCLHPNNYLQEIYPDLVKLEQKDIDVVCIAGDIGLHVNEFEYVTPQGVTYLATGMEYSSDENKILKLTHTPDTRELTWRFEFIRK